MKRVLIVGSAEQSAGGVASVIRMMKRMPVWDEYSCYWLGTQIQRNYAWKLWYALKAYVVALFIIWRYDIVHFHTVPDRLGLIIQLPILILSKLGKKRIVTQLHVGNQLDGQTENNLFKWFLRQSDVIILLARRWQILFQDKYPDVKVRTEVIYNTSENVEFVDEEQRTHSVIYVGYMDENKAPDILLKAWQRVKEQISLSHTDHVWKLYMLGNGDVERYKLMSKEMGLGDSVIFTGYVTGKEKESYFRKASIYCLCSYNEGFPMAVLEAWNYGIPVVSTPVGGLPDVIEEGKNCCTFDFGNDIQLTEKLLLLMDDADMRHKMSVYERKFVHERFSLEAVNQEYRELYHSM